MKGIGCLAKIMVISILLATFGGCDSNSELTTPSVNELLAPIEATGELNSSEVAIIGPPNVARLWQYKIQFMIPEGTSVKKGQPILGFDKSKIQQDLNIKKSELNKTQKRYETEKMAMDAKKEQLKLQLAEMKMNEEKAKRKWQQSASVNDNNESRKLAIDYEIAKVDLRKIEFEIAHYQKESAAKISITQSELERLSSEVKQLENGIKKMTVLAPKDGMVIYKPKYDGEKFVVGDTVYMGHDVLEIPTMNALQVKASIDEVDARRISLGFETQVKFDAIPNRTFAGKVTQLGNVFKPKSREIPNVIFEATIELDEIDEQLMRPGMSAQVSVQVANEDTDYKMAIEPNLSSSKEQLQ